MLEKHRKNEPTFAEAFVLVVESKRRKWSNPREAHDWLRSFESYAKSQLGDMPVSTIEPTHVLEVLDPIWTEKPTTAKKRRTRIGAVTKWAIANGYRTSNPAGDILDGELPRHVKTRNFPAVPHAELSGVIAAVHASGARSTLSETAGEPLRGLARRVALARLGAFAAGREAHLHRQPMAGIARLPPRWARRDRLQRSGEPDAPGQAHSEKRSVRRP